MSILPPLPAGFRRLRRAMLLSAAVAVMFAAAGLTLVGTGGVAEATADWGPSGGRAAEQVTVHGQWSIRVSDSITSICHSTRTKTLATTAFGTYFKSRART